MPRRCQLPPEFIHIVVSSLEEGREGHSRPEAGMGASDTKRLKKKSREDFVAGPTSLGTKAPVERLRDRQYGDT